jgi:hypothetical protein
MDFIFEDEIDEVGSDIEAYCPKCKADTSHTVITKYEDEVRRVQCSPCGDVHTYRRPRGDIEDETPEPVSARKRAAVKKPSWQEAMDRAGQKQLANARPYSIRDSYDEGDTVKHPKFGVGFVTEISENKVEITFQDERRVLIHNRPDLAAQMPSIAQMPAPRDERKGKGRRDARDKKGGKKVEVVAKAPPAKAAVVPGKPAKADAKADAKVPAKATAKPSAVPAKPAKAKPIQGKAERAKAAAVKKSAAKVGAKSSRPAARPAAKAKPVPKPAKGKVAKGKK